MCFACKRRFSISSYLRFLFFLFIFIAFMKKKLNVIKLKCKEPSCRLQRHRKNQWHSLSRFETTFLVCHFGSSSRGYKKSHIESYTLTQPLTHWQHTHFRRKGLYKNSQLKAFNQPTSQPTKYRRIHTAVLKVIKNRASERVSKRAKRAK